MITASPASRLTPPLPDWRLAWRQSITDPRELLRALALEHLAGQWPADDAGFPLRVPRGFVARMQAGNPRDPLLLQVLPQLAELTPAPGFSADAVGDHAARGARGLLHKYPGRVLLIASGTCAVNCRYCFRRHFPYADDIAATAHWRDAIDYVQNDASIEELILSGGDPLALATPKLAELTAALAGIPHLRRLRIHSRLPVVLPERIDGEFCNWLAALPFEKVLVIHANHGNEIDTSVIDACTRLRATGTLLLNQSVLLAGINDSVPALAQLSRRLLAAGVLPYYLHQLDRVSGTAHFEVPDARARALIDELRGQLSGYLVPRLVREVAGEDSKQPLWQQAPAGAIGQYKVKA